MKKIIGLLLLIGVFQSVRGQDDPKTSGLTREYYLQKSKSQKTAYTILGLGGSAMFLTGMILVIDDVAGIFDPEDKENSAAGTVLLLAGSAASIICIPLMIASKRNSRKAMGISLKNMDIPVMESRGLSLRSQAAITLNLRF